MDLRIAILVIILIILFISNSEGFQGLSKSTLASVSAPVSSNHYDAFYIKTECGKYISTCARSKICLVSDMAYADLWSLVPLSSEEHPNRFYIRLWRDHHYMNSQDPNGLVGLHQQPEPFEIMLDSSEHGKFYISHINGKYLKKDFTGYMKFDSKTPVPYYALYLQL